MGNVVGNIIKTYFVRSKSCELFSILLVLLYFVVL